MLDELIAKRALRVIDQVSVHLCSCFLMPCLNAALRVFSDVIKVLKKWCHLHDMILFQYPNRICLPPIKKASNRHPIADRRSDATRFGQVSRNSLSVRSVDSNREDHAIQPPTPSMLADIPELAHEEGSQAVPESDRPQIGSLRSAVVVDCAQHLSGDKHGAESPVSAGTD